MSLYLGDKPIANDGSHRLTGEIGDPIQIFMPTSTESNPTENKTREIAFVASEGAGERCEGSLTHTTF